MALTWTSAAEAKDDRFCVELGLKRLVVSRERRSAAIQKRLLMLCVNRPRFAGVLYRLYPKRMRADQGSECILQCWRADQISYRLWLQLEEISVVGQSKCCSVVPTHPSLLFSQSLENCFVCSQRFRPNTAFDKRVHWRTIKRGGISLTTRCSRAPTQVFKVRQLPRDKQDENLIQVVALQTTDQDGMKHTDASIH